MMMMRLAMEEDILSIHRGCVGVFWTHNITHKNDTKTRSIVRSKMVTGTCVISLLYKSVLLFILGFRYFLYTVVRISSQLLPDFIIVIIITHLLQLFQYDILLFIFVFPSEVMLLIIIPILSANLCTKLRTTRYSWD